VAVASPEWSAATGEARRLWETRHQRGDIDERAVAAKVVFVGGRSLIVEAEGVRLTFSFDTRAFDRQQLVLVSRWFKTAAGTPGALRLTQGQTAWSFDPRGQLLPG
jgi:hypothetical protein